MTDLGACPANCYVVQLMEVPPKASIDPKIIKGCKVEVPLDADFSMQLEAGLLIW